MQRVCPRPFPLSTPRLRPRLWSPSHPKARGSLTGWPRLMPKQGKGDACPEGPVAADGSADWNGAVDCDFHPRAPSPRALAPYMEEHWRDTVVTRGIDTWASISYPANAPLTLRPDWRDARADAEPVKA